MSSEFEQAYRLPTDGPVSVSRTPTPQPGGSKADLIQIYHQGPDLMKESENCSIQLSEYNAARVLVMLSVILGVRLNREDAKRIQL